MCSLYTVNCVDKTPIDESIIKVESKQQTNFVIQCPKCGQKYLLHTFDYQLNYCCICGKSMRKEQSHDEID